MNPIYKFLLSVSGETAYEVFPIWRDLTIEFEKESGEEFFRRKLNGKLTFQNQDYLTIRNNSMDILYDLTIQISYDRGAIWTDYWYGFFYKTDCEINESDRTVIVTPRPKDEYDAIINALDKEVDIIPAAPQIVPVGYYKRPVVQFYVAGQAVMGCYLDGIYWEQSCQVETDPITLNNTYKLGLLNTRTQVRTSGQINDFFWGDTTTDFSFDDESNTYTYHRERAGTLFNHYITRVGETQKLYGYSSANYVGEFVLQAMEGSGMTGTVTAYVSELNVYARLICDVEEYAGVTTEVLPDDDITETTYHRSVALNRASYGSIIVFSSYLTDTPTQWGIYQPTQYYGLPGANYIPMARNAWGRISIWLNPFNLSVASPDMFEIGAKKILCKECYPIESVIGVMFNKLGLPLTYGATDTYSKFFYGDTITKYGTKIKDVNYRLYLTPKSNILKGEYDQAAQKAIVTLREVFDMIRKCFQVYWFVENGKLRFEHIYWFKNGGSYPTDPVVERDLTSEICTRNGKALAFAIMSYNYDKPDTIGQYQFAWMDDVTIPFKGEPIKIISPYVEQGSVDNVDVSKFTSDLDYMQVAPSECSLEGFAIMACVTTIDSFDLTGLIPYAFTDTLKAGDVITSIGSANSIIIYPIEGTAITIYQANLPYTITQEISIVLSASSTTLTVSREGEVTIPFVEKTNTENKLQNGYLSFWYLQRYYKWDMPAPQYKIGEGDTQFAYGVKRFKTQEVNFPAITDLDTKKLIKTFVGEGQIEKISINLSSRNARVTLKYDENQNE